MEACNSHKCHCPRCMRARQITEEREQLTPYERLLEARRKEAWKRLARQHHIDQAGVCCAPHAFCNCPNCIETREFYAIRPGERIAKTRWAPYNGTRGRGWRQQNIATHAFFGPTIIYAKPGVLRHHIRTRTVGGASIRDENIIYTTNPNSANNWAQQTFTDPPPYMSAREVLGYYRAHYGLDTPWSDPPRKTTFPEWKFDVKSNPDEAKEQPVLTSLQLAIIAHYSAHPGVPYPYTCSTGSVSHALAGLVADEFLERTPDKSGWQLSGRSVVFLRAINTLPLPVRKPAPWTMPS